MDLAYNGVYRMIELSEFHACRGNINNIMLIPTIMQRLDEVKVSIYRFFFLIQSLMLYVFLWQTVIEETKKKLFQALKGEVLEDKTEWMRKPCDSPVVVEKFKK